MLTDIQSRTIKWYETQNRQIRLIVLGVILLCIWLFWRVFFMVPMDKFQTIKINEISVVQQQIQNVSNQIASIKQKAHALRWTDRQSMLQQFNLTISRLYQQVQSYVANAITLNELSDLAADMVSGQAVVVSHIHNLSPQPWITSKTDIQLPMSATRLVKYPMEVDFHGNFLATVNYLTRLNKLKWPLGWNEFHYQVTQWPDANVHMSLYALGHPSEGAA